MKITASSSEASTNEIEVTITATMPLRQWKVIHNSLRRGQGVDWSATTSTFLQAVGETIHQYTKSVSTELNLGDQK